MHSDEAFMVAYNIVSGIYEIFSLTWTFGLWKIIKFAIMRKKDFTKPSVKNFVIGAGVKKI